MALRKNVGSLLGSGFGLSALKKCIIRRNSQTSKDVDCNVDTVVLFLVVMSPDQKIMRHCKRFPLCLSVQRLSIMYYDDIVSTTELVYNLILGSNCNHSTSKAEIWYSCALAVLCTQCAAIPEATSVIRCGLRRSVDIKALSTHKITATAHQHAAKRQRYTSTLLLVCYCYYRYY